MQLERRTLPGETVEDIRLEVDTLLDGVDATARVLLVREPFAVDADAEIVDLVGTTAGAAISGAPYWTDAAFLAAAGIPAVLYRPSGAGAHATEEWVSLSSCDTVATVLTEVARRFCA